VNYHEKLAAMQQWCNENVDNVEEFSNLFDIAIEDMIRCFPDALVASYYDMHPEEEKAEQEEEDEHWKDRGYHIISQEE
jgi:energy-converting hydrogenase A subunit M